MRSLSSMKLSLDNIKEAYNVIPSIFKNTPHYTSLSLSQKLKLPSTSQILLKNEMINPIGSFKGRGVSYYLHKNHSKYNSICTASAGNFGQAVAYCSNYYDNIQNTTIFVAENASPLKIDKMRQFDANVIQKGNDFDSSKNAGKEYAKQQNIPFIEDGKELEIMEGAATIAMELIHNYNNIGMILIPVGNGALISGISYYFKEHYSTDIKVIGICSDLALSMYDSYISGKIINDENEIVNRTIADGIDVRIPVYEGFKLMEKYIDGMQTVNENDIISSMKLIFETERLIVEGSGAVGIAVVNKLMETNDPLIVECIDKNQLICTILTGSNLTREQINKYVL